MRSIDTNTMKVSDYYHKYVEHEHRRRFMALMEEYDGSRSVFGASYTISVLEEKHKEAKETHYN
jgi:hypothetical protein